MPLENLNHVNVRTVDMEATRQFYVDVLGLYDGDRPAFGFGGFWFYLGDRAIVHIVDDSDAGRQYTGGGDDAPLGQTGSIDHIAFEATGLVEMVGRLEQRGIPAIHRKVPGLGLHQVFLHDPNGVKIELNYPAAEGEGIPATP